MILDEERALLRGAISGLNPKYEVVLRLRFFEGRSPRDVADLLGIPLNTVRSRTQRALFALRDTLSSEERAGRKWVALAPLLTWKAKAPRAGVGALVAVVAAGLVVFAPRGEIEGAKGRGSFASMKKGFTDESRFTRTETGQQYSEGRAELDETMGSETPASIDVLVTRPDGTPAPGALVHGASNVFDPAMYVIGATNEEGLLRIESKEPFAWLAARGEVGELSRSQARSSNGGRLELHLRRVPVAWVQFDSGRLDEDALVISDPASPQQIARIDIERRVVVEPIGVTPWRDPAGRFGIPWRYIAQHVAVVDCDGIIWRSRRIASGELPPERMRIDEPWTLCGRVVSWVGDPLPGQLVTASVVGTRNTQRFAVLTGADGRFAIRVGDHGDVRVGFGRGRNLAVASPVAPATSIDLGDYELNHMDGEPASYGTLRSTTEVRCLRYALKRDLVKSEALRSIRGGTPTAEVQVGDDGNFEVPHDSIEIAAFIYETSTEHGWCPVIERWAPEKWGNDRINLVPPTSKASVLEIADSAMVPSGIMTYSAAGSRVDVPIELENVGEGRLRALLPAGRCDLRFTGRDERLVHWADLDLEPGGVSIVNDPAERMAHLTVDWNLVSDAGLPEEELLIRYGTSHRDLQTLRVQRKALPQLMNGVQVAATQQLLTIRDRSGRSWGGSLRLRPGERRKLSLVQDPCLVAIAYRSPAQRRALEGATIVIHTASGDQVASFGPNERLSAQLELVVPRAQDLILSTIGAGLESELILKMPKEELVLKVGRRLFASEGRQVK